MIQCMHGPRNDKKPQENRKVPGKKNNHIIQRTKINKKPILKMVKHAVKVYSLKVGKGKKMNGKCRWHPYQNYANFKNLKGNPRKKYVLSDKKKMQGLLGGFPNAFFSSCRQQHRVCKKHLDVVLKELYSSHWTSSITYTSCIDD